MASAALSASRQQHWFSTAGHSSDLACFAPSLGPSQQAESRGAEGSGTHRKPFLFACTPCHSAQGSQGLISHLGTAVGQGSGGLPRIAAPFIFFLNRGVKTNIIEVITSY